ncbi:spinster family MFS transporter [Novosphingobium sp.]|uniref:spinster family MFS transporter n=1 Tax=Novosphingobium sp. TaxID=1874826 RepID=UPI002FE2E281
MTILEPGLKRAEPEAAVPAFTPPDTPVSGGEGGWSPAAIYTLAMLTITFAFNYFDRLLISLLFPLIQKDLSLSDTDLGLISGVAFVLIYAFMGIPVSRIADRGNRKWIIGLGFSFWSLMTVLTGFVTNFWQLAATRFLMGAGESSGTPSSSSMLSDLFDKERRPVAFSVMVSGTSISGMLLTPAAGWIAQLYGWRAAYWIAGGIGLFFGLVVLLTVKEPQRGRFDPVPVRDDEARPALGESLLYLLRRRTYVYTTLAASLFIISFYAYIVWNTTFMVRIHHMSVAHTASLFGPIGGISGLIGGLSAGPTLAWLNRRDERWQFALPALCFLVAGGAQYAFLFAPGLWGLLSAAALGSFAVTMAVPLISLILIQILPPRIRTFGMAFYFLANSLLGDILGPLAVGLLNDHFQAIWGDEAIRRSMAVTAAMSIVSAPVLLLAGRYLAKDRKAAEDWIPATR